VGEVVVRGVPVRYAVDGPDGGPEMLLVHGSGAHRGWWYLVVPHLVAAGVRVVALDLSGHGDSGHRADYDAGVWGEELLAVAGQRRPLLVAHSLGGRVGVLTAAAHPDAFAGLVLVDTPLRPPPSYQAAAAAGRLQRRPREQRRHPDRDDLVARFRLAPPQPHPPAEVMRAVAERGVREVDGMWAWKHDAGGFPGLYGPDLLAAAATLRMPVSYVYGAESALVNPAEADFVQELVPGDVRVIPVAGGSHHLSLDRPAACAAAILLHLEGPA
jgi:pimeloyl-ACP methyl ester carboxylesterase